MWDLFNSVNQNLFWLIFHLSRQSSILDNFMIFGAKYLIFLIALFTILLTWKGFINKKGTLLTLIALPFGLLIEKILNIVLFEPRPFVTFNLEPLIKHLPDAAFPSTHTLAISIIAFSFYFYKSKYQKILFFAIIFIGFARIYVGVHYPIDILGGILLGFISVLIVKQVIFEKLLKI